MSHEMTHEVSPVPDSPAAETARFARTFLAVLGGSMLLVVAINVAGNGEDLFPSPLKPALSDRAWKARRLEAAVRAGTAPRALILGTSRVVQMGPTYVEKITGRPTFNLAVTGGNLLDCLSLFRFAIRGGARPDLVIMNVDEGMLVNGVTSANLRLAGHWGLVRALPFTDASEIVLGVLKGINQSSTVLSLGSLAGVLQGASPSDNARTLFRAERNFALLPNGYRINLRRARARALGKFDLAAEIRLDIEGPATAGSVGKGPPTFSPRMIDTLRTLLGEAKAMGIEVKILTTPEHPLTLGTPLGVNRLHLHDQLVSLLRAECGKLGFTYRDFTDLASFGGDPDEFWDAVHQTPLNMARMTNSLFGLPPDPAIAPVPSDAELLEMHGLLPPKLTRR